MGGSVVHTPAVENDQVGIGLEGAVGGFHDAMGRERREVRKKRRDCQGSE